MKLPRRNFLHLAAGAAALPAVSRVTWAPAYPSRPVRINVGYPITTRMGCARRLRLDRDDTLDLDRDLVWQHDVADRGAGMPSSFAEHFDK
jgi:hypothetical protein